MIKLLRHASEALIFIFLIRAEPLEAANFLVPYPSEDTAAAMAGGVGIDNCSGEISVTENWRLIVDANSSCIRICHGKPDLIWHLISQISYFSDPQRKSAKIIVTDRSQWTQDLVIRDKLSQNPTFDDCSGSVSLIDKQINNVASVSKYISYDDMRPMTGIKFVAAQLDSFPSKASLYAASDRQNNSKKRDDDSRGSSDSFWGPNHSWRSTFIITLAGLFGFAIIYLGIQLYILRERR